MGIRYENTNPPYSITTDTAEEFATAYEAINAQIDMQICNQQVNFEELKSAIDYSQGPVGPMVKYGPPCPKEQPDDETTQALALKYGMEFEPDELWMARAFAYSMGAPWHPDCSGDFAPSKQPAAPQPVVPGPADPNGGRDWPLLPKLPESDSMNVYGVEGFTEDQMREYAISYAKVVCEELSRELRKYNDANRELDSDKMMLQRNLIRQRRQNEALTRERDKLKSTLSLWEAAYKPKDGPSGPVFGGSDPTGTPSPWARADKLD